MNKKNAKNTRLELDTELIADLETDGDAVLGGATSSGAGSGGGGSFSVSVVVSRREGPAVQGGGGGLNAC